MPLNIAYNLDNCDTLRGGRNLSSTIKAKRANRSGSPTKAGMPGLSGCQMRMEMFSKLERELFAHGFPATTA